MMANNRPGSILYALGMTQHTTGVQGIRSFTILQLLLGNIGKPGGGVNALRGEPNVQGACDMAVLYNYMPGYLNSASNAEPTIYDYVRKNGIADSRYLVNTLKAFFGEAATAENDYAYAWLPKRNASKDYGTLPMFEDALAGKLKVLWIVGQNPAVTVPNLNLTFEAMAKLETLVVQEIWETETAAFWRRPGVDPKSISTEVILLPAAFFMEKNGTISNSGGMVQWRHAAVKPPGQSKPDGEIVDLVFRAVRDLVKDSKEPRDEIIRKAFWNYTTAEDVLREINGYALRDNPETGLKAGDLVRKVSDLRADGSTSSGAWIYAGVFANGENLSKRRDSQTDPGGLGLYPGFGWTWPNNMRILYNRASCDRNGKPYPGSKPIVWWDEQAKRWTGYDVPDVPVLTDGPDTPNGQRAFHLGAEGVGRLFAAVYSDPDEKNPGYPRDVAYVPKDGPLPEMYEPVESPVENILHPRVKATRCSSIRVSQSHQPIGTVDKFPYVLMTSTVAEHWCAGSTTRNIPWLNELVPEPMLEMPVALAQKLGVKSGDWVRVSSARGELEVKALVTPRMKALKIGDQRSHRRLDAVQLGIPGAFDRPERQPPHDRRRGSRSGNPGDQGVPRQRGQGRPPGNRRSRIPEGTHMTTAADAGSDQGDADRHHQLHRLPGVPGSVQAVERTRRRADRVRRPRWASRTRRRSARRLHAHHVPRDGERARSREAWSRPS